MFRTVISFTPFMVCLFWSVIFSLRYRRHDSAKRVLTWFLLTCTVLYFCHALFFTVGSSRVTECIWALCSLSVYPIYYLYVRALTVNVSGDLKQYAVLLPGLAAFLIIVFMPGRAADLIRMTLFTLQILFVCWSGTVMLRRFDRMVASCYADVEGKKMTDVRILLFVFVLTSIISAVANILGRTFFAGDDRLLVLVAVSFSTMLFALSYIGYFKEFSYKELSADTGAEEAAGSQVKSDAETGRIIDALMLDDRFYLKKGLKITDLASRTGLCRTYVSNYINQSKGESFSDYVNRLRVEEAKSVLDRDKSVKLIVLADQLGFANEQSFYRNFKKFTGMTPAQWREKQV